MRNQKGITMASLGIYIVVCMIVVAMLATITANYRNAIKDMDDDSEYATEYSKFNLYFLEETKNTTNKKPEITNEENNYNSIKFQTGNEFKYDIQKKILYLNKNTGEKIKLIKKVESCTFKLDSENGKNVITVNIEIAKTEGRELKYVLEGTNNTELYASENEYTEGITKIPTNWDSTKLNENDPFRTEKINVYYNIAPIPNGYEVSTEEGENKISEGLIITDGTNRFKWYLEEKLTAYKKENYGTTWTAAIDTTDLADVTAIYNSFESSKDLYGGAYIEETTEEETIKSILWIK